MMNFILSIHDFLEFEFLAYAFLATLCLSLTCAILSPFVIARKNSFIGAAISHSTLLGLSIALSIFSSESELAIFLTTLAITTVLTSTLAKPTTDHLPDDSKLGIFYTSTMALGILIYSMTNSENKNNLMSFLFGNILLLSKTDLIIAFILLVVCALVIFVPIKKWLLTTIDPIGARARGINTHAYQLTFFVLMTLVIVTSIKIAGTILIETLILTPGFFALNYASSLKRTFLIAIVFALITAPFGLILANFFSLPSGATLAVVQFTVLLISLMISKGLMFFKSN